MTTRRIVAVLGVLAMAALFFYALVFALRDVVVVAQSPFAESGTFLYVLSALLLVTCVIGLIPSSVRAVWGRSLSPTALVVISALFLACSLIVVAGLAAWFFLAPNGALPSTARTVFLTTLLFGVLLSVQGVRALVGNVRYYRRSRVVSR